MQRARVVLLPTLGDQPAVWYLYQRYFTMGLRMLDHVRFRHGSPLDAALAFARERHWKGADAAWRYVARHKSSRRYATENGVGRFEVQFSKACVRVAIDTHDGRGIPDPGALEWSQLYLKSNFWPTIDYGSKVRPLVCGNGALDQQRIARLVSMRNRPRNLDLVFVAKLWPGTPGSPTYWNPVEHVVRVFETLAKLPIRAHLRAVVVPLAGQAPFPRHYLERLSAAGVRATTDDITVEELWSATSGAQLAFLRPGKHLCVSWRMIDHLAMGAATLCDHAAYPQWPVPLRADGEFLDCDCGLGPDESLPSPERYERIAETVMTLLRQPERMAAAREAAARYFDAHAAPARIARYLVDSARAVAMESNMASCAARNDTLSRPSGNATSPYVNT